MMTQVKDILRVKGHDLFAVSPQSTVYDAMEVMAVRDVGALAVTVDEKLVGIISERDYARKVILMGKSSKEIRVEEIMSTDIIFISKEERVDDCLALMTHKRVRHLVTMDGDDLVGMISIGDLVKSINKENTLTIEQMEKHIRRVEHYMSWG